MPEKTSKTSILVVDDEPLVVEEICEFLETNGFRCIPCNNSRQAIDRFNNDHTINLVLCDLVMPEYDGIELIQQLKINSEKNRVFNAVLTSAHGEKEDVIRALREGFSDYHQKPINPYALLETLKKIEENQKEIAPHNLNTGDLSKRLQDLAIVVNDIYSHIETINPPTINSTTSPLNHELTEHTSNLFSALSPRQQEVAKLVSIAKTNYQISCDLGITENTAKVYVSQILSLMKTSNRTQLALALSSLQLNQNTDKYTP